MSKLALPVAELLGSPLSSDELKSIVGGNNTGINCICSWRWSDGTDNARRYTVESEQECLNTCSAYCHNGRGMDGGQLDCNGYQWSYMAGGTGYNIH